LRLSPLNVAIPGDISSAAFFIVAAAITPGSRVTLKDVGLNPTRTGLLDALRSMGSEIQVIQHAERSGEPVGDIQVSYVPLQGTHISGSLVVRMIDEFPVFAIAASCAQGQTRISQAEELRHKESDRISALCAELRKLGINSIETPDGFIINGGYMNQGGIVEAHGDHRLAMALSVADWFPKAQLS
jgi:3-phosphoshikimate 1-carboxyvinyltransferase